MRVRGSAGGHGPKKIENHCARRSPVQLGSYGSCELNSSNDKLPAQSLGATRVGLVLHARLILSNP